MVSTILSHSPGGASSKLCTHMAQIFRNGEHLSKYDYGPEINLKVKVHTLLDLGIIKLHTQCYFFDFEHLTQTCFLV